MKHSAIPWYQHPADVSRIVSADELAVATVFDADDGAFIVRACNAHDALVELLGRAEKRLDAYYRVSEFEDRGDALAVEIRAAHAKATS